MRLGHLDSGVAEWVSPAAFALVERRGFGVAGATPIDHTGHGTRTASLLTGATGVSPEARLLAAAAIEDGNIVARLSVGLDWLIGQGARVIVAAVGIVPPSQALAALLDLCAASDILVVCPIGNGGAGRGLFPATLPSVLSVGACDHSGRVLGLSGSLMQAYSPSRPAAPIVLAPGLDVPVTNRDSVADTMTGTSPAAALVGGAAALLRAARPEASAQQIVAALIRTATPLAKADRHRSVAGCIRPAEALAELDAMADNNCKRAWPAPVTDFQQDPTLPRQTTRLPHLTLKASGPDKLDECISGRSGLGLAESFSVHARLMNKVSQLDQSADVDVVATFSHSPPHLPIALRDYRLRSLPIAVLRLGARHVPAILTTIGLQSLELADIDRNF